MSNLLPCPFCGGEALMQERYMNGVANLKHYRCECRQCKATFERPDWFRSMKKAAAAWNRRADAAPVVRCGGCRHAEIRNGRRWPVTCHRLRRSRHLGDTCEHGERGARMEDKP